MKKILLISCLIASVGAFGASTKKQPKKKITHETVAPAPAKKAKHESYPPARPTSSASFGVTSEQQGIMGAGIILGFNDPSDALDLGPVLGLRGQYRLLRNHDLGLDFTYWARSTDLGVAAPGAVGFVGNVNYKTKVSMVSFKPFYRFVYVDLPAVPFITPFGGMGVSINMVKVKTIYNGNEVGSGSDTSFGVHPFVGSEFNFLPYLSAAVQVELAVVKDYTAMNYLTSAVYKF